jgi:hypothetical protein
LVLGGRFGLGLDGRYANLLSVSSALSARAAGRQYTMPERTPCGIGSCRGCEDISNSGVGFGCEEWEDVGRTIFGR